MALLLDVFAFLSVILHGLVLTAQCLALGGIAFLALLAQPLAPSLGEPGRAILVRSRRLTGWSAVALVATAATLMGLQVAALMGSTGLGFVEAAGADFFAANLVKALAALAVAVACWRSELPPRWLLLALGVVILVAATATTHSAARLDGRAPLAVVTALHQAGAGVWIGGIPYFLIALARCRDGAAWRRVGRRFSLMSMGSVAAIGLAGTAMAFAYIGEWQAFYGTAYGLMTAAKIALFGALLLLGLGNYRLVERLRQDPATPILRLRRFAEVEIGVGITVLFAAASLTSLPPGTDLSQDRASWHEIVERMAPAAPRLKSPSHGDLAIPALQAKLDAEAASRTQRAEAFVPGAGQAPPRNAFDIAWSEYNHHWAGLIVLAIGLLALAERSGYAPWAKHWPLLFLLLAAFLLFRSDPETWPMGDIGFFESFRDPEVVQHRVFVVLTTAFAFFEWSVRTGRLRSHAAALVFPIITAVGGAMLLTHSHALANVKEELLIEATHLPLALCGIAAGWARWLELRLDGRASRVAAWVWPVGFVLVGLLLIFYREA